MKTRHKVRLFLYAALASFSIVATSESAPHQLACGGQRRISEALARLKPGDTLSVSGACNENVVIPEHVVNVTLDGRERQQSLAQTQATRLSIYEATGLQSEILLPLPMAKLESW